MSSKSNTLQGLKAELEHVDAAIAKYSRVRKALVEVISYLGNEEVHDLINQANEQAEEEDEVVDYSQPAPALPKDGIEAVRKALAARSQA